MRKFKVLWRAVALVAIGFCFALFPLLMGNAPAVTNEGVQETPAESQKLPTDEETTDGLKTLVDGFLAQLRDKYGEDYETYYNAILDKWGSIEEYLLSLVGEEDEAGSGWISFVNWLHEYAPVWGSVLAVALLIIVILFGKSALRKVSDWVTGTGKRFHTIYSAFNTLYAAQKAQNDALLKLLGENERFQTEREALEKASEELTDEQEL